MALQEVRVGSTQQKDVKGQGVLKEAQRTLGVPGLEDVRTAKVFRLEGVTLEEAQELAKKLLSDPIDQT